MKEFDTYQYGKFMENREMDTVANKAIRFHKMMEEKLDAHDEHLTQVNEEIQEHVSDEAQTTRAKVESAKDEIISHQNQMLTSIEGWIRSI